jgi:hypothetical protein
LSFSGSPVARPSLPHSPARLSADFASPMHRSARVLGIVFQHPASLRSVSYRVPGRGFARGLVYWLLGVGQTVARHLPLTHSVKLRVK